MSEALVEQPGGKALLKLKHI